MGKESGVIRHRTGVAGLAAGSGPASYLQAAARHIRACPAANWPAASNASKVCGGRRGRASGSESPHQFDVDGRTSRVLIMSSRF